MNLFSTPPNVVSVMLAAGGSTRFNGAKLAATLSADNNAQSLIQQSYAILSKATTELDLSPPVLVLGGHKDLLSPLLANDIEILTNQNWQSGLASSVAMAASYAQSQQADVLLLTLADQVAISHSDYLSLYGLFCQFGKTTAAYYQQSPGVPAIFLASDFEALQQLEGDSGAKKILTRHLEQQQLTVLPLAQAAIDIDTQTDLKQWLVNKE
ncbi:nucleotidyltransferase family protein [Shewanella sp. 10N.286.51.B2]|uniref:nucleotidyltransferase family protein n=1 Tax=unclassified Shewanella TaxID=196818 RepID=UPI0026E3A6FA|nr:MULTISPECIES: nucleotidyltransferase family protein [unclassified Shewanella]MDO6617750.1 nucleotidyltransferase family protein [Shewanella sp. 6_MG-2023]MDO6639083.1 nucleotidyltransferase family protein [Shewanella sp. 5_MG-2023]